MRDFIEALKGADGPTDAVNTLTEKVQSLGFETFTYALVPMNADAAGEFISFSNLSPDWLDAYQELGLHKADYTVQHCLTKTDPLLWSDLDDRVAHMPGQFKEATHIGYDYGLVNGITLPLRSVGFFRAGISLVADKSLKPVEVNRQISAMFSDIQQSMEIFHAFVDRSHLSAPFYDLSSREIEVLQWLAQGLKLDAVAFRMGTARSTVEKQALSARRKMKSATITQAVAKAALLDLL